MVELIIIYYIVKLILCDYYLPLSGKFMYVIIVNTVLN